MEKCEVIPAAGVRSTVDRSLFPSDVTFRASGDFELLGGPIGSAEFCNSHTQERVTKATKLLAALGELPDPQVALPLLRHCASFGKLVYSTRVVPPNAHASALKAFDVAVRECFESFTCCNLEAEDWSLATLSSKLSGLGLRSAAHHSPAAFLSSRATCHSLCSKLDPDHMWEISNADSATAHALTTYNDNVTDTHRLAAPLDDPPRQRELSAALDNTTRERLKTPRTTDPYRQAHLELTSAESAGRWLHTLPSKATHNNVDPLLFKTMIQRWLRVRIFDEEYACPLCDGVVDVYGDHCLVCSGGGDRTKRHNLLRNTVYHFCTGASLTPELEKPGLLRPRPFQGPLPEDGIRRDSPEARRPADVFLPRWRRGVPMALDFAVTSGLRRSNLAASLQDGSAAVKSYEDYKNTHLDTRATCITEGFNFTPMVVEAVGGGWGPSATKVFYELAKTKSMLSGELKNQVLSQMYQNLGIILHRENARSILRRCCAMAPAASQILATAATLQSMEAETASL